MSTEVLHGVCDGCGETGPLREFACQPFDGVCMCETCVPRKGSEMPVLELAPAKHRPPQENAMALSANVGGKHAIEQSATHPAV